MSKTGIVSCGFMLPKRRLKVEEIVNVWNNTEPYLLKINFKIDERTVLHYDEDVITLSAAAAKYALEKRNGVKDIGAIYLGTCTNPYESRSSAAIILEMLGIDYGAYCADIQFAGKSGTSAMQIGYAMVKSGVVKNALVIGADTISRHTAPGDLTEPYAGAGACAMVIGEDNVIAQIDGTASYVTDCADTIRPQGERYFTSGMDLGSDKNDIGLIDHTVKAAKALMEKMSTSPTDYNYLVVQQYFPATVYSLAKALGFTKEQAEPCIYSGTTGDVGSASAMLGLAKVLDTAKPGEKILMASYGFGAGSDAIALTVTDEIIKAQNTMQSVDEMINNGKIYLDYANAIKHEYKYLRSDHAVGVFL